MNWTLYDKEQTPYFPFVIKKQTDNSTGFLIEDCRMWDSFKDCNDLDSAPYLIYELPEIPKPPSELDKACKEWFEKNQFCTSRDIYKAGFEQAIILIDGIKQDFQDSSFEFVCNSIKVMFIRFRGRE